MNMRTTIISALVFGAFCAVTIPAQDSRPAEPQTAPAILKNGPRDGRGRLLQALGLSEEQMAQVRQINLERRPLMEAAQKRLREAVRALDAAIYADDLKETDVEAKLAEVQSAQAEVSRLRYMNEMTVRQVLTPEQLAHFRELRQRFEDARKAFRGRRNRGGDRPMGPFRRGRHNDGDKPAAAPPVSKPE